MHGTPMCLRCKEGKHRIHDRKCTYCGSTDKYPVRSTRNRNIGGKRGRNSGSTSNSKKGGSRGTQKKKGPTLPKSKR